MKRSILEEYCDVILIILSLLFEIIMYMLMSCLEKNIKYIIPLIFIYSISIFLLLFKNKKLNLFYIIFILGLLLRTLYIFNTDIYTRQHDVGDLYTHGHLDYIFTLYKTHHLPLTNEWQYYHPPFWHILGALWLHISDIFKFNLYYPFEGLQILTLLFSSFTILLVDKICIKLKVSDKYRYLIDLLFAIHPTLIYFSGSINNDCLLLFLEILIILLLINFYENDNWKNTIYLAIVTGLCVMTKMNGVVMAIPILYIFIYKFINIIKNNKFNIKPYIYKIVSFGIISLPIGLWFQIRSLVLFSKAIIPEPGDWLYVGNHNILSRFFIININEISNYANMSTDYNLPSFIIKSSLFGEYTYYNINFLSSLMIVLNIILIFISVIFLINYIIKYRNNKIINILVITWFSFIISIYLFNYSYPYACSMDFRYIAICLLPGIVIPIYYIDKLNNIRLKIIINVLFYLFILFNIIFIFYI